MAPTLNDLIGQYARELNEAESAKERAKAEIQQIVDHAGRQNRANLTDAETARTEALFREVDRHEAARKRASAALARAREEHASDELYDARARDVKPAAPRRTYEDSVRIGREARTYSRANDPNGSGKQFLLDISRQFLFNDVEANERLARHMREERVERGEYLQRAAGDTTTTNWAGLTVPQYLTDLYAPAVANLRPLANVVNSHTLPQSGMSLNLSRVTTASSAALQATELSAVSATSLDDTLLTIPVQTAAGQQNVSRQAIERGTGIEDVTVADLFRRVATVIDSTLINQATTGISATAQLTTYTDAAPTGAALWPMIFKAESLLEQTLLGVAPVSHVVMHPRRWNWLCSQVGSTWPFLGAQGSGVAPQQFAVQVTNEYGPSVRGVLSNGLQVVVDANVPTTVSSNQDEIYVIAANEIHLWEDPAAPVMIRAEQPNAASLGVLLVAYSYFAYTAQRYSNNPGKIVGTGTAAPSGF